ncbi:MAG: hypothetical protein NVSMB17_12070 [Candidatus Dormibacteria bacterium]
MNPGRRAVAPLVVVVLSVVLGVGAAAATPGSLDPDQRSHLEALKSARTVLESRRDSDQQRAARALAILRPSAEGELEAIHELEANPPGLEVAKARIETSIKAFDGAVRDPDPQASGARLHSILAEPRFHPGEDPVTAVVRAVRQAVIDLVRALLVPGPLQSLAGLAALLVVVVGLLLLVPALRRPFRGRRALTGRGAHSPDLAVPAYFGEAETMAQAGDYAGAVRALAAGTMDLVTGQRSYITSPMTVREAFGRSGHLDILRPLLKAFESSYYGRYQVLLEDYAAAAAAAASYRHSATAEVAA